MPPIPTRSLLLPPTSELSAPTSPFSPVRPSTRVTAPVLEAAALFHSELTTTKLPFGSTLMPSLPT